MANMTNTEKKPTKREAFNMIIDILDEKDEMELKAVMVHEVELLDAKKNSLRKTTAKQEENEKLIQAILEAMDAIGQPATIKELMEAGDLAAKGIKSNQHMNSLLIKARKGGLVKCTHEKNVAYFGRGYDEKYYNEDGTPKTEE